MIIERTPHFLNLSEAVAFIQRREAERRDAEALAVEQAVWMDMHERDLELGGGWNS